jgi:SAM-dependent methyltransferase
MNNDRITEVYDGVFGSPRQQRIARQRVHWMCAQVRGDAVLDVGCSQGIVSILLARERHDVIGVDREEPALEFARARLAEEDEDTRQRLSFVHADAASLPFEDNRFDTVMLGEVIEHLVDPGAVLAEAARVLRPGGVCVLTVPYGILPYHDHKEPLYLVDILRLLPERLAVEHLELVDRYLAMTLTDGPVEAADVERDLLEVAERRLRALDEELLKERHKGGGMLAERVAAVEERIEVLAAERASAEQLQRAQAAADRYREFAQQQRALAAAEIDRLQAELARATFRLRSLERQLERGNEALETLERRDRSLFDRLERRSAEALELHTRLRELRPRRAEAERRIIELEAVLAERERQVARLRREREALLADVSALAG